MTQSHVAACYERAEHHFQRGEYALARAAYLEVLQVAPPANGGPRLVVIAAAQRLAEIGVLAGEWDAAVDKLELVRTAFAQSGNSYMADYASTRIAAVQNARGMGRAAWAALRALEGRPTEEWDGRAAHLPTWEAEWTWAQVSDADRAVFFSHYYLEAGQVEVFRGQFERATSLLRRGLDWARRAHEEDTAVTALCLALVSSHLQRGDVRSAAIALDLVPDHLDERTQPGSVVFRLELKGRLDLLTGNLGSAKTSLERALEVCTRTGFHAAWRAAALNLSQVLVLLNQTGEARRLCEQTLESARASGDTAAEIRATCILSFADERTQSFAGGISLAPSVTDMWLGGHGKKTQPRRVERELTPFEIQDAPDYLTLFEERAMGFFWLLSRGSLAAAGAYLEELERIFLQAEAPTDSLVVRMRLHGCACMLAYYEGRYVEVVRGYTALCDGLRDLGLKPDLWQALRFLEWALMRLGRTSEADAVGVESTQVLSEMTDSLAGADLVLFLLNKWTDAERYMATEVDALVAMKRALAHRSWFAAVMHPLARLAIAQRLAALLDYADRYKASVFERSPGEGPAPPSPAKEGSLLKMFRHGRSRVTVACIVLPDMLLVAKAGWASLDFGVSGVSRIALREWVRQWHEAVRDQEPAKAAAAMNHLGAALQIEEVMETLPRRIRGITFVPDDILHGVPIAALRYGQSEDSSAGRYVGATHAVTVSFDWLSPPRRKGVAQSALVVGIPYGSGPFDPLPNAAREAREVATRLRARGMSVATAERRAEILRRLPGSACFHIACHGRFEPDHPDRSGLVIISESRQVELLTVRDLARLDLRSMEQAVLSGCWAADSYIIPGRWIVSVPAALCRRGARAVLASLWPIDDRVAERFFLPLYEASSKGSVDERLFRVRQEFINRTHSLDGEPLDDPFFWAGVQLYAGG